MSKRYHAKPLWRLGLRSDLLKSAAILAIASFLCEALYRLGVGSQNTSIVMILAVFIISATTDGYGYSLGFALTGVLIYDFLITAPRFGFSVTEGYPITLSMMLLVSLTTSAVTARIKKHVQTAKEKEKRAEMLYDISRKLLSCRDERSIARYVIGYLKDDLQRSVALYINLGNQGSPSFYFRGAKGDVSADFFSAPEEWDAVRLAASSQQPTGVGSGIMVDQVKAYYRPVQTQGTVYGVFGISCREGPVPESHQDFLNLITEQTAQALRVQMLTAQRQEAKVAAETEKARSSFLRGISHDLRTPLTSIIGASATLLENSGTLPADTQQQLLQGIQEDSLWLMSMVENVLSITRIQQNGMRIKKNEEIAEEVVGEAVSTFRKRYPLADIQIQPPTEVLLVPMDALLITRVIHNLLDNSLRHSHCAHLQIRIQLERRENLALFIFSDNGRGIPEEALPGLFEVRPERRRPTGDSFRGLGIGLSICKAIIDAHGGWIDVHNLPQGGAQFTFALPVEPEDRDGK